MQINKLTELSKEVSHLFFDDSAKSSNFVSRLTMTISHDSAESSNFISCFTMTIGDCGIDHFSNGIVNASNFISRFTMTGGSRFGKEFRPSANFLAFLCFPTLSFAGGSESSESPDLRRLCRSLSPLLPARISKMINK